MATFEIVRSVRAVVTDNVLVAKKRRGKLCYLVTTAGCLCR